MYGSMDDSTELIGNGDKVIDVDISLDDPFSEKHTEEFWNEVETSYIISKNWPQSVIEIRIKTLNEKCEVKGEDIMKYFFDTFDAFEKEAKEKGKVYLIPSFIQQLGNLCKYVLDDTDDKAEKKYESMLYDERKTVLHLAAERNLYGIIQHILQLYPGQCYLTTDGGELPFELAVNNGYDESAALLAKNMKNKMRVRGLFQCDKGKKDRKLNFAELCSNENMQKTTEAVLDCLYEPCYQYSSVLEENKSQEIRGRLEEDPMSYKFYYQILDGDSNGRPAKIEETKGSNTFIPNPDFNSKSFSGLYSIAYSPFSEAIIAHPVIRHLTQRKWNSYGDKTYKMYFFFYLVYILVMSLAFFLGLDNKDSNTYITVKDTFRGIFEAITLMCAIVLLLHDVVQMIKLKKKYLKEGFNYLNLIGTVLIICWYLCKWLEKIGPSGTSIHWALASIAYLASVLCVFRYLTAFKFLGVYIRTFIRIIQVEISMFILVFAIIMAAFTGSVILAMKASNGFAKAKMNGVQVFLQEVRALFEGQGFAPDYIGVFSTGVIILLMINMLTVIIVLANVLIGQINNTYNAAAGNANVQYDVDKLRIIVKLDIGSFHTSNYRIQYYQDMVFEDNTTRVQETIKEWNDLKSTTTTTTTT